VTVLDFSIKKKRQTLHLWVFYNTATDCGYYISLWLSARGADESR